MVHIRLHTLSPLSRRALRYRDGVFFCIDFCIEMYPPFRDVGHENDIARNGGCCIKKDIPTPKRRDVGNVIA